MPGHESPDPASSGKFRWPPREPASPAPTPIDGPSPSAEMRPRARPVMPVLTQREPAAVSTSSVPETADEPAATAASLDVDPFTLELDSMLRPSRSWWRDVERTWLGPTHEPFAQRAAETGWRPDEPDAYCPHCGATVGPYEIATPEDLDALDDELTDDEADATDLDAESQGPARCLRCRNRRLPWDRAFRLGSYDGLLRDALHELKFTRFRAVGSTLGRLLGARLAAALDDAGVDRSRLALVPVPMSRRRRLARGIDHTLVLARAVRAVTGGSIINALARRHRPSQLDVPPSDRRANVSGSFRLRGRAVRPDQLAGWTVIVIDDVRTTGATLREACRTLRRGISRADPSGRRAGSPARLWIAVAGVTPLASERGRVPHREITETP